MKSTVLKVFLLFFVILSGFSFYAHAETINTKNYTVEGDLLIGYDGVSFSSTESSMFGVNRTKEEFSILGELYIDSIKTELNNIASEKLGSKNEYSRYQNIILSETNLTFSAKFNFPSEIDLSNIGLSLNNFSGSNNLGVHNELFYINSSNIINEANGTKTLNVEFKVYDNVFLTFKDLYDKVNSMNDLGLMINGLSFLDGSTANKSYEVTGLITGNLSTKATVNNSLGVFVSEKFEISWGGQQRNGFNDVNHPNESDMYLSIYLKDVKLVDLEGDLSVAPDENTDYDSTDTAPYVVENRDNKIFIGAYLETSKIKDQINNIAKEILDPYHMNDPLVYENIKLENLDTAFTSYIYFEKEFDVNSIDNNSIRLRAVDSNLAIVDYNGIYEIKNIKKDETYVDSNGQEYKLVQVDFGLKNSVVINNFKEIYDLVSNEPNLFLELNNAKLNSSEVNNGEYYSLYGFVNGSFYSDAKVSILGVGNLEKSFEFDWQAVQGDGKDLYLKDVNDIALTVRLLETKNVSYNFKSENANDTLPAGLLDRLSNKNKTNVAFDTEVNVNDIDISDFPVAEKDGVWKFVGWDKNSIKIGNDNITFTGSWRFVKNDKQSTTNNTSITSSSTSKKVTCADEGKVWNESKGACLNNVVRVIPNTGSRESLGIYIVITAVGFILLVILRLKFRKKK